MKTPFFLIASLVAVAPLAAQPTLQTATGYADFANAGTGVARGVPAGTTIDSNGLQIRVADGGPGTMAAASASTSVRFGPATTGLTVAVAESGNAAVRAAAGRAAAGTSDDPRQGTPGAHGLALQIPGSAGDTGVVVVNWRGSASANASTGVAVDVDGDGMADFSARVSGGRDQQMQRYRVRAGARGFLVGIVTSGNATAGSGPSGSAAGETYDGSVSVTFNRAPTPPTCTFRPFGPECGGKLDGRAGPVPGAPGIAIQLALTGAAPNALAVLAIGAPLPMPVQLPGSRCDLLVNPRGLTQGRTDANGDASWNLGLPLSTGAFTVAFQAITAQISPAGIRLASSNGLGLSCQ
ncbi:MAG: hypothetical protein AAF628_22675 [Planctomycetota bacterium]